MRTRRESPNSPPSSGRDTLTSVSRFGDSRCSRGGGWKLTATNLNIHTRTSTPNLQRPSTDRCDLFFFERNGMVAEFGSEEESDKWVRELSTFTVCDRHWEFVSKLIRSRILSLYFSLPFFLLSSFILTHFPKEEIELEETNTRVFIENFINLSIFWGFASSLFPLPRSPYI